MFGTKKNNDMSKPAETTNGSVNLIGVGTIIEGEIKSNGDIRIDGTVSGSLTSKAKVVVGNTGIIEGDVNCQNADVSGKIKGKLAVSELLFLKSTSFITGDIITKKLVVEAGANFTGSCNMGAIIKDMKYPEPISDRLNQKPLSKLEEKTA